MKHVRTGRDGTEPIGRREALRVLGTVAAAPLLGAVACTRDVRTPRDGASGSSWASGGTASMTDVASYPDPFADAPLTRCALTCEMTKGPCYDPATPSRLDVSEAQRGVPVRLALRLVDEKCEPITDADVDIWHCDRRGVYSSATVENVPFCTGNSAAALASQWFRGTQSTNERGIVAFHTCFPGWYPGRAIHIHFTVRRPGHSGAEYATSQLFFDQALSDAICTEHVDYAAHGPPDTTNASDGIAPASGLAAYVLDTSRMTDGAMLASKTLVIRSSLTLASCGA